jgi:hypothetical protein
MVMSQKQPNRNQLNLLLPIGFTSRKKTQAVTSEKAKIEESRRRLMRDLERSGLVAK